MRFYGFLLLCFLVLITGAQAETQDREQVFLKLNQYYVFTPEPYYINSDNRFMVPLKVVDELIGAGVVFNKNTKTAVITFSGQEIKFTADSNTVTINDTPVSMHTKAVFDKKAETMFIPIYILIDNFHLNAQWHPQWRQLDLKDERIMKTKSVKLLEGGDLTGWVSDVNAFRITHFDLRKVSEDEDSTNMQIEFTAENITGHNIYEGEEDIHYWIFRDRGFTTNTKHHRPRQYIKAGDTIKRVINFNLHKGGDPRLSTYKGEDFLKYIIIWPRTRTIPH